MKRIKAAIVGAGLIAGKKHIPAFIKHKSKVDLVALCDLNEVGANKLADEYGIPRTYTDIGEMIEKEKPDLVDICTPPQTHVKLSIEAMRRGCNVLIEKPMALSVAECDAIVDASKQYGVKVCVGHSDLFYYPFMDAQQLVAKGAIGEFRGMRIFLSTPTDYMTSKQDHWAHKLPGGVIGESGPHVVYMTLAFINPIRQVSVDALKILDFPWSKYDDYRINLVGEKAVSSVTLSYTTDQWAARVDLLGSKGILTMDLEAMYLVNNKRPTLKPMPVALSIIGESGKILQDLVSKGLRLATGKYDNTHDIIVDRFADAIIHDTPSPVSAEEGREAVRVLAMIVDALEKKEQGQMVGAGR
uniref:NADH-dependent dehydrogenase n=1 Tax=uncultured bacterium F39-01 TaxID=1191434 RepID=I3VIE2_9BACT|nr:NADH-dependent dehydrogenase [uncultured bacterium F39-01]